MIINIYIYIYWDSGSFIHIIILIKPNSIIIIFQLSNLFMSILVIFDTNEISRLYDKESSKIILKYMMYLTDLKICKKIAKNNFDQWRSCIDQKRFKKSINHLSIYFSSCVREKDSRKNEISCNHCHFQDSSIKENISRGLDSRHVLAYEKWRRTKQF